jgi:hypothetical protein
VEWLWYGVIFAYALGMVVWYVFSVWTPQCRDCRIPAIALAYQIGDTSPPIFQLVYRCPRCRTTVWKRYVNTISD